MASEMLTEASWQEFWDAGLIWWANRVLHLAGWALVVEVEDGKLLRVYPARCKFRGFDPVTESEGFRQVTKHIVENGERLLAEAEE